MSTLTFPRYMLLPVYTYVDAGRYAATNPQNVRNWFKGQASEGHKMRSVFDRVPRHGLSYVQLIEVAFVAAMRRKGLALDEMRRAYAHVRRAMQRDYPFAEERFKTDGIELFIEAYGELLAVGQHGRVVMREALEAATGSLDYADRLVARWHPRGRDKPIIIDPRLSFGRPVVEGTGVPTLALAQRFNAGESIDFLAHDFALSREKIEEALRFENPSLAA